MRIVSIGGGPGGLYSAILLKKLMPGASIEVIERNRPDDTFGWGVVFSDETLGNFREEDPESFGEIERNFIHWTDIDTFVGGQRIRSTGHGFCGLSRKRLLQILQGRARSLGVQLRFETDVPDLAAVGPADLIIAADGVNSRIREQHAERFHPSLDWRRCRFSWLGTTKPMDAFTFVFKRNEHGLFRVHAYPFEHGLGTWIVECLDETWRRAGFEGASEEETVAYCERLFAEELGGHRLLANRSVWRVFPTIRCESWHFDNVVLIGDAAHTAHFSIGSGTKLAMEDAICLRDVIRDGNGAPVPRLLTNYQEARTLDVLKLQRTAQTSLEWFENTERYEGQSPLRFTFNLMSRSKRITWDNLETRDPAFVGRVSREWHETERRTPLTGEAASPPPPAFTPYRLRNLELVNRVVVSPMCQYSAVDGVPQDWHLVHLGSLAVGGAGLVIAEMTDVEPEGRITTACAGLWNEAQAEAWKRVTRFVHASSHAKIGVQLAHAGRKASTRHPFSRDGDRPLLPAEGAWTTYGPSALPFGPDWPAPKAMDRADMDRVRDAFVRSTELAKKAGFDLIELHMAHGYLLSSFLSPFCNRRSDEYGGDLEGRMRFPLEVLAAVRKAWPSDRPLAVRISATDWLGDQGTTAEDSVLIARALKEGGCDLVDVSTGGNSPDAKPIYGRMYQVPFAEKIRYEVGMPVMTVGGIEGIDHVNTVLAAGRADLCAIARAHLADPYLTRHAAQTYGYREQHWPDQQLAGRRS